MTARSFISSHRNCSRFLAATHHAAILNNYSHDLQVLHFTLERGDDLPTQIAKVIAHSVEGPTGPNFVKVAKRP